MPNNRLCKIKTGLRFGFGLFVFIVVFYCETGWCQAGKGLPRLPILYSTHGNKDKSTPYKNIHCLNHLGEIRLSRVMGFVAETLGIKCGHCHVENNYALDEKTLKRKGRRMIAMVQKINEQFFSRQRVTCYTCHVGKIEIPLLPEGIKEIPSLLGAGKPKKLPEDLFINVRKLNHLDQSEYLKMMNFFLASVGAKNCNACHQADDYSSDERSQKKRARAMIGMIQKISPLYIEDERLTCYTCHQGKQFPGFLPENWLSEQ